MFDYPNATIRIRKSIMAADANTRLTSDENFEWNVENEIRLFEAMIGHKPVGINKHFHMACITEKFETLLGKPISSDIIWKHLESMYDLAALDKKESLPFPNDLEEFSLPESEYSELINEKIASKIESTEAKDSTKEMKNSIKVTKDCTPTKETVIKKERKSETEDVSTTDTDKKDLLDSENEAKKRKLGKDKEVKTRGKRSMRDKKHDEDTGQTLVMGSKKDENSSTVHSSSKKENNLVGKRSLRSRVEDSLPSKAVTPPPVKRARRI